MEQENGNRKQTIFLGIIGIATLLVALLGATFAWFSARVSGNDEASSVIVETATLGITYTNGNEIRLENAVPGATDTKTFTVASDGATTEQHYSFAWEVGTNDFVNKNDLVYSITGTAKAGGTAIDVSETACPEAGTTAVEGTATIKPLETHEYNLTVTFKETETDQDSNQGAHFYGKIVVNASSAA